MWLFVGVVCLRTTVAAVVVGARGPMSRGPPALGVPPSPPFAARLGAVDRSLIAQERLLRLTSPDDLVLERRPRGATPPLRDPDHLVDLILEPAATRLSRS